MALNFGTRTPAAATPTPTPAARPAAAPAPTHNPWGNMGNTSSTSKAENLVQGQYKLRVGTMGLTKDAKFFIGNVTVLESYQTDANGNVVGCRVGSQPAVKVKLLGIEFPETALGNVKAYVLAAIRSQLAAEGKDPSSVNDADVDEGVMLDVCGAEQPLLNVEVYCTAFDTPQKKNPSKMFTNLTWAYCTPGQ